MSLHARHAAPATVAAGLAALALAPAAAPAQPFPGPGYPKYANEGRYPRRRPASTRSRPTAPRASRGGGSRSSTPTTGAAARSRGSTTRRAPARVTLDRSADGGRTWSFITETVDPGDNFAYTQVGNNLSGRVSRGALVCDEPGSSVGTVVARTNWF